MNGDEGTGGGVGGSDIIVCYMGQPNSEIPRDMTHLIIDSSVKLIAARAFQGCEQLAEVELCEGLVKIGKGAFKDCKYLKRISKIPSTVKDIAAEAFSGCEELVEVELCEGLEEIGYAAFSYCYALRFFKVPSTVKKIVAEAFIGCDQLVEVELCEGLEEIGQEAFEGCKSLKSFKVPSTVKVICYGAFYGCEQLEEVEFCEDLNELIALKHLIWGNWALLTKMVTWAFSVRNVAAMNAIALTSPAISQLMASWTTD